MKIPCYKKKLSESFKKRLDKCANEKLKSSVIIGVVIQIIAVLFTLIFAFSEENLVIAFTVSMPIYLFTTLLFVGFGGLDDQMALKRKYPKEFDAYTNNEIDYNNKY